MARPQTDLKAIVGQPEARRTLSSIAASRVRELILTGRLQPTTALPLRELASTLGVSVMLVREALRQLEAEGLVTIDPHRGATVAKLGIEEVEELYAVRAALEGLAARIATGNLTAARIDTLHALFERMERAAAANDEAAFVKQDRAFHNELYKASRRPRLVQQIQDLHLSSARALPLYLRAGRPLSSDLENHRPILEAVEQRDAQLAEQRTREHLEQAASRVLEILRESPAG